MNVNLLDKIKADLRAFEGTRSLPYTDTTGHLSIGVGRNLSSNGVSHDEIEFMLNNDCNRVELYCFDLPWFASLSENRQRVIFEMIFQLGEASFEKFTNTIAAIKSDNFFLAANHMRESTWHHQCAVRVDALATALENDAEVMYA